MLEDKAMGRKTKSLILNFLFLILPLVSLAVEPTSFVFSQYHENYTVIENKYTEVAITFSSENPLNKQLFIPLAISNIEKAEVKTNSKNLEVSLITIDSLVYLNINPDIQDYSGENTISIVLLLTDFITKEGFFFQKKLAFIPLISNYPKKSKNNIFIEAYEASIHLPLNYNHSQKDRVKSDSAYHINLIQSEETGETLMISAEFLNLHSINHKAVLLSIGFNPVILMLIIIALLTIYLVYFSSLIKSKE